MDPGGESQHQNSAPNPKGAHVATQTLMLGLAGGIQPSAASNTRSWARNPTSMGWAQGAHGANEVGVAHLLSTWVVSKD